MSILHLPVAATALALICAEMPLHAIICAGLGVALIELVKPEKKEEL